MVNNKIFQCSILLALAVQSALSFSAQQQQSHVLSKPTQLTASSNGYDEGDSTSRRGIMSKLGALGIGGCLSTLFPTSARAEEESESFASIAARANQISKEIATSTPTSEIRKTDKTMYDFSLPLEGADTTIMDIVKQQFSESGNDAKVKAVLVVNIKQDDPVARKDIPELISLVTK